MPNGISNLTKTIRQVSNAATKGFKYALPPLTIVANVMDIQEKTGGNLQQLPRNLIVRYTGADINTGQFKGDELLKGAGSLLLSAGVSKALTWLGL